MKKIGIVGGIGWLSTVDYYTEICRRSERQSIAEDRNRPPSTPEMSIESLNLSKAASLIGVDRDDESWSRFDEYHRSALRRLEASGADFALIASNTPHHRFDSIVRGIGIPVLNIFEAVAEQCARLEAEQVLILGTAVTMASPEFRKRFAERGIESAGPGDEAARALTADLIAELQGGESEGAAHRIGRIAKPRFPGSSRVERSFAWPARNFRSRFRNGRRSNPLWSMALHMSTARPCTSQPPSI